MEIFVSEKELIASCDSYEFGKELVEEILSQDSVLFKSLEQHDKELLQEFADELINIMKTNGWEFCEIRDVTSLHVPNTKYTWFDWMLFKNTLDNLIKERGAR